VLKLGLNAATGKKP